MSEYRFNPKTSGSQVICCVPQKGRCPVKCADCFFQPSAEDGKSRAYLGENYEFTPNVPSEELAKGMIVRVNDVNDSNHDRKRVQLVGSMYEDKFYNTSMPKDLEGFVYPVVLTANPAKMTDCSYHQLHPIPKNLMFVRARVNTWNLELIDQIVMHYTGHQVHVVLTFMAYYETPIPEAHKSNYSYRQRTTNSYWVIRPEIWDSIAWSHAGNHFVRTCGADAAKFACTDCRNCENLYKRKIKELGLPSDVV